MKNINAITIIMFLAKSTVSLVFEFVGGLRGGGEEEDERRRILRRRILADLNRFKNHEIGTSFLKKKGFLFDYFNLEKAQFH
ncbi:hypothetical protein HanPI659440_Chr12g0478811 [Helianthus annuus]|nr:hypothetical protein HanPI659440_Chr12g0478811 [Helianthus annuus]